MKRRVRNAFCRLRISYLAFLSVLVACGQDIPYRVDLDIDLEVGRKNFTGKLDEVMKSGDSTRVILGSYSVLVTFHGTYFNEANIGLEVSKSRQGDWKPLTDCNDVDVPIGTDAGVGIECGRILLGAGILIEPME